MLLDSFTLVSGRGVQQGDPLGPALFSLATHERIQQAKSQVARAYTGELDFTVFFLDDGTAAGSDRVVALFCVTKVMAKVGLDISFGKCEVIPAGSEQGKVKRDFFLRFPVGGLW